MTVRSQETKALIEQKLKRELSAVHLDLEDETWRHAGHAGAASGGGHFIVTIVSPKFEGLNALDRRRLVFRVLQPEMQGAIHALTVRAFAPGEWRA